MWTSLPPHISTAAIRARRGSKAPVDPRHADHFFREQERSAAGVIEDIGTVFLTNRECPFTCVFCDLWQHTLDQPTPRGAIVAQLEEALPQLMPASVIKLYNAGNFFDPQAIPPADWPAIATLVKDTQVVIVENHPRLTDERVLRFRDLLSGRLEVALGLETAHPETLARLNKQMTVADFERSARWLREHDCDVRAFVQLGLTGTDEAADIEWTVRSIETAFAAGAQTVSVIVARASSGVMQDWQLQGLFTPPRLETLHTVQERGLALKAGRVFVDLWNAEQFATCATGAARQIEALKQMNLTQIPQPWPVCPHGDSCKAE
jgi:radical SAM enzyme (TIGR01210 family)